MNMGLPGFDKLYLSGKPGETRYHNVYVMNGKHRYGIGHRDRSTAERVTLSGGRTAYRIKVTLKGTPEHLQ